MSIWLEQNFPEWRTIENEKQIATQIAAGITYIDMGKEFPNLAHQIHWDTLMKENPTIIGTLRNLLVR